MAVLLQHRLLQREDGSMLGRYKLKENKMFRVNMSAFTLEK